MSRTERNLPPQKYYNKESSENRRKTRRIERHRAVALIQHERYDDVDTRLVKNTEGWETH